MAGPNVSKNIVRHQILAALTAMNTLDLLPGAGFIAPTVHTSEVLQLLLGLDVVILLQWDLGKN